MAVALVPASASATTSDVEISSAQLIAKGAMVDVTLTLTCTAGNSLGTPGFVSPGIFVEIQQAVSKTEQTTGAAFTGFGAVCTGSPQTFDVQVLADSTRPPFRTGSAVALAQITDCDPNTFVCATTDTGWVVIKLKR